MANLPSHITRYLQSRGVKGPWKITGIDQGDFEGAVVIPALAEGDHLFATLQSLAQNPAPMLSRFLVLVVVNHREDAPQPDKANNELTLQHLAAADLSPRNLHLGWVDAASKGFELPSKGGGVGLARKIGLDLSLPRLRYGHSTPPLICLDADTFVRPDYLPALRRHFQGTKVPGAVIPFCHRPGSSPDEDLAIQRYELFLRVYVLGLSRAGSPYAFHTVGSAMACPADAYCRMGGMNLRAAAEDFYFLQQLAKTGGIAQVKGTVVYPSARPSHRVPFGTGRSMSRLLCREEGACLFYRKDCYQILGEWLALITQNPESGGDEIQAGAEKISPPLGEYLDNIGFIGVWDKLRKNFPDPSNRMAGFHGWFDGLKTMKLIHHLSAGPLPRGEPEDVVPGVLEWAGLEPVQGIDAQLTLLRKIQIGEAY